MRRSIEPDQARASHTALANYHATRHSGHPRMHKRNVDEANYGNRPITASVINPGARGNHIGRYPWGHDFHYFRFSDGEE